MTELGQDGECPGPVATGVCASQAKQPRQPAEGVYPFSPSRPAYR